MAVSGVSFSVDTDRIGSMYLGKMVELGSSTDIYPRPAHPYTAGLLAAIPVPEPEMARASTKAGVSGELPSAVSPPSGCRFRTRCPHAQDLRAEGEPQLRSFGPGPRRRLSLPADPCRRARGIRRSRSWRGHGLTRQATAAGLAVGAQPAQRVPPSGPGLVSSRC
jgi:oligopeptide/dipeptide ABC transporter ATP-binding protein